MTEEAGDFAGEDREVEIVAAVEGGVAGVFLDVGQFDGEVWLEVFGDGLVDGFGGFWVECCKRNTK